MSERRQCEFFLLRYVPDAVREESVNLGVVLVEREGEAGAAWADVRFVRDWRRFRCLDPDVDIELLEALERELRERLREGAEGREWLLKKMEDSFSGAVRVTPGKAVLAESPQAELETLAQLYLERAARSRKTVGGRQAVFGRMRDEFERQGVWRFMRKNLAASEYTHPGDPLKIDCGYSPVSLAGAVKPRNGDDVRRVKLFHALSLAPGRGVDSEVNQAKALAFSFPRMRNGMRRLEQAETELTAIVEADLGNGDEGISFALEALREQEIRVATLAQMAEIAEQARLELHL